MLALAAIASGMLVASAQAAAPKPGAVCTKLNQTILSAGYTYSCIKSGKKLIWSKGVKVSSPTPSLTPINPSTNSVDENGYATELSPVTLAAYKDFLKTYKSRMTTGIPNIQYIVEPHMNKDLEKQIKDTIYVTAKYFSKERPLNVPVKIWIAMSAQFQWLYDQMNADLTSQALEGNWLDAKLDRAKTDPDGFMGGAAAGDGKDKIATLFFNGSTRANWGDSFWSQVPGHEFTHVVQRYELGGTMGPMLCWVREGNANYTGWLMAGRNSQAAYRNFWLQALSRIPTLGEIPDFQSKPASFWTNFFVDNENKTATQCDPWINYILGAMAFEYLGGTYGNDAIESFYLGLNKGWIGVCNAPQTPENLACPSWKIVFKKSFGVTPEEIYPKFGQYIADEIQWAKGKQVLWNQEAINIAPIPVD
jgi:hypothetical protein